MVTQTIQPVRGMAMTELVQARGRVDAQTVADARRTPAVPITRFSYDRRAMQEARLARGRIGAPTPDTAAEADETTRSSTEDVTGEPEEDDSRPLLVVPCIAEYPEPGIPRRAERGTDAAARASAVARAAAESSEAEVRVDSSTALRRPVDHVTARAEATAADARLRTAALAARAEQLRARLGGGATIDLRGEASAPAAPARGGAPKRRRLVRA